MTSKAAETTELTPDDADYARLNRAKAMVMKVCEMCELDADEALNVVANVLVLIAVHECIPRGDVVSAIGEMYDARLKHDMEDETLN